MAQRKERPPLTLGVRIAMARAEEGRMTLRALSRATGIPASTLSAYERGLTKVPAEALVLIATALGTTPNALLGFQPLGRYLGAELVLSGQAA